MSETNTYLSSGVDIDEAQRALRAVTREIQKTHEERVLSGIGGFGALFQASFPDMQRPVLVASIDGVGTKTKLAASVGKFEWLGHDIVNHCVNDILCQGAKPLFFLDYFGTSKLRGLVFEEVLLGMSAACLAVGASLIGGETAEMPGVYMDEEIDLVGSVVGVVDQDSRLPRGKSRSGDALIGIFSDGLHTNGFSLARRALFELGGYSVHDQLDGYANPIGLELLKPHRCYFPSVYPILQRSDHIQAIAHITGGGLYDNLPRVISSDTKAVIERRSWDVPPLFRLIQAHGNVPEADMFRTFNMGIGLVLVVERTAAPAILDQLHAVGERAALIGEISTGAHEVMIV